MPKKKKKNKRIYFGQEVQDAIVRYNQSDNADERNIIYQEEISYAFDKLAENIIHTFKFTYFDYPLLDVQKDVVSFLVMNIHKYDHTKGSKAFSYFSVVAKNYLILHNNTNYKRLKKFDDISLMENTIGKNSDRGKLVRELMSELIVYFETEIPSMFKKRKDMEIAYAILEILKKQEEIENFNKKSLYILIREMTDVNTTHITKVVNVLKRHYKFVLNKFYKFGTIHTKTTFF